MAIKMLQDRIHILVKYVAAVIAGIFFLYYLDMSAINGELLMT
jgi:hypothetical protein